MELESVCKILIIWTAEHNFTKVQASGVIIVFKKDDHI